MDIKVGQVWQNNKNEKFYIKEVCNKDSINSRVTFISLQNTDDYFAGEIGSCSYECFMYQVTHLKLVAENFSISEELDLELKLKSKIKDIDYYKTKINDLQNKINTTTSEVDKLYDKLKEINPYNTSIFNLHGVYFTDDELVKIRQMLVGNKNKENNRNANKKWYKITCPSCGKTYKCTHEDNGTHYYNFITEDGIDIIGATESGELECPNCHEWYKENKWNFKEV